MKRKQPVVNRVELPTRSPTIHGAVLYLLLDRFDAAGWVWGVAGTLYVLLVVASVIQIFFREKQRSVFGGVDDIGAPHSD